MTIAVERQARYLPATRHNRAAAVSYRKTGHLTPGPWLMRVLSAHIRFSGDKPAKKLPGACRTQGMVCPRTACWFGEGTFARTPGDSRDAPIAAVDAKSPRFPGGL